MNGLREFSRAVLNHWGWLTLAMIAFILYTKANVMKSEKIRMVLILVSIASLIMVLYLVSAAQYRALHEHLKAG